MHIFLDKKHELTRNMCIGIYKGEVGFLAIRLSLRQVRDTCNDMWVVTTLDMD